MTEEAKSEIRKMLEKCGDKLVERLVADPFLEVARRGLPKNTKPPVVSYPMHFGTRTQRF